MSEKDPGASGRQLWRSLALLALFVAAGWVAWRLRAALYPLLFGFLIAIAILPAVRRFERRMSRTLASLTAILIGGGLLALLLIFAALEVQGAIEDLFRVGPQGEKVGAAYRAAASVEKLYDDLDARYQLGQKAKALVEDLPERLEQSWKEIAQTARGLFDWGSRLAGSVLSLLSLLFLTPVFAFLILLDYEKIRQGLIRLARAENRPRFAGLTERIESMLGTFLRGRFLTGFLKGSAQALLLFLGGAPYALLAGVLSWAFCFVPIVGPAIAFGPTILILAVEGQWALVLFAIAVLALGEIVEGYLLIPRFIGPGVGLSALELLLALLIGGAALGFLGLFLSVPVAAIGKLLLVEYLDRRDEARGHNT